MLRKLKMRAGRIGHSDSYINKRSLIWGYQIWLCGQCLVCYSHNKAVEVSVHIFHCIVLVRVGSVQFVSSILDLQFASIKFILSYGYTISYIISCLSRNYSPQNKNCQCGTKQSFSWKLLFSAEAHFNWWRSVSVLG